MAANVESCSADSRPAKRSPLVCNAETSMVDEVLAGTGAIGTHREIERPARNQRRRPRAGSAAADLWIARIDYAAIAEASPKMP